MTRIVSYLKYVENWYGLFQQSKWKKDKLTLLDLSENIISSGEWRRRSTVVLNVL
jgi:hypothetical protein